MPSTMAARTSDRRRQGRRVDVDGQALAPVVLVVEVPVLGHHVVVRPPEEVAVGEGVDGELQTEVAADERVSSGWTGPGRSCSR